MNSMVATPPGMAMGGLAHMNMGGQAPSAHYYSFGSPTFHNFGEASAYADGGAVHDLEELVKERLSEQSKMKPQVPNMADGGMMNLPPELMHQLQFNKLQRDAGLMETGGMGFASGGSTGHPMGEPLFMSEGASVNHYVQGPGTGQSDDIPAMLADGEYVLDAETVAALGDGSNKAGAQVLDQWRQQIRAHKRGGGLASIPPKSLGPDGYMAKVKGGM